MPTEDKLRVRPIPAPDFPATDNRQVKVRRYDKAIVGGWRGRPVSRDSARLYNAVSSAMQRMVAPPN